MESGNKNIFTFLQLNILKFQLEFAQFVFSLS